MQKQFEQYLQSKNYSATTAIDYPARLERLCKKEKFSYEHLAQHLNEIMPQYEKTGKKSSYGKKVIHQLLTLYVVLLNSYQNPTSNLKEPTNE